MSYLITKAEAETALKAVMSNPLIQAFRDPYSQEPFPTPKIQRPSDAMFNRDDLPTDQWYFVWANGYAIPAAPQMWLMMCCPGQWPREFINDYMQYKLGHQALTPGTGEGIVWKD